MTAVPDVMTTDALNARHARAWRDRLGGAAVPDDVIEVRDGIASPGGVLWAVHPSRGTVERFTALRMDAAWWPNDSPVVVAEGKGLYPPYWCWLDRDRADAAAARVRAARRGAAETVLSELEAE